MALSAKEKGEMESFVSCLNNLLSKFRYKLEAGQAEAEGAMLLLPVEPGDLNQRWSLGDNGWERILVEQEQPERDHMGPGGYMIHVQPKPEPPVKEPQVDQPKNDRQFRVGDRVKCLDHNYTFVGHAGTIVGKNMSGGGIPIWLVEIDGEARGPWSHYAEDMELLSSSPASFSSVKTILGVWASLPPFLQKDAAEDTLRMLVRVYGGEKE